MEMFIQFNDIQRFAAENGRIPNDRRELGDYADGVQYVPMAGNAFRLIGTVGDITVDFTSSEPLEDLLADAKQIVSGEVSVT